MNRIRVTSQEPCGFCDDRPTSEQRPGHIPQSFDTSAVKLVASAENGNNRASVHQDPPHLPLPNPLRWRRFVLKSLAAPRTEPIIPASSASWKAERSPAECPR